MKRVVALLIGWSWAVSATGWSRSVDLSAPGDQLGAANPKGYLEVWSEVEGVGLQLGKDSYLPLRYKFSSESDKAGLLGAGFYLPMFEARSVLLRENTMRAYLPCGKGLYLWRTSDDPNKFETPDKVWTGCLSGDDFTVSRDDGWKVFYQNGRLSSIVSDDKRKFSWLYDNAGGGTVEQDGRPVIELEPGPGGQAVALVFGGKDYKIAYGKRPITAIVAGQTVLKELVPALTKLEWPDGRTQTFEFGLTKEQGPELTAKDADGLDADYTWDAASRYLLAERTSQGEWNYQVGEVKEAFDLPPISRISKDGKTEGISADLKSGVSTRRNADGSTTIVHAFTAPGPLYGKTQRIEKVEGGETSVIFRAVYDETGKLIRATNAQGLVTSFVYNQSGKVASKSVSLTKDPEILSRLHRQEERLKLRITAAASDAEAKQQAIRDLAQFYLNTMRDQEKATPLISQIDHNHLYILRVQGIDAEESFTPVQKAEQFRKLMGDYPDHKTTLDALISTRESEGKALEASGVQY